eukprot:CAMPEP_0181510454 /NCGR_PEP_ID=MMETSP1110-20121109/60892_1 /TAXON_ID=174948 /ORGANISM="Symbiodinium sp., Strain CCMP421" /LENGTH=136 /DNA_ID=CAMNT_0023640091 /DNA_START=1181 /DNA_END=1591 /DNA_ORIENTATION=-
MHHETAAKMAYVRLGSRKGCESKTVSPKMLGAQCAGYTNSPPKMGPKKRPTEKQRARKLKPRASFVSSTISPRYVRVTPMFPQKKPSSARAAKMTGSDCPKPKMAEPARPMRRHGFLPAKSANIPQNGEQMTSKSE